MFLRNNEEIDTEILRNRVLLEVNRLKRRMTSGLAAAAQRGKSGVVLQRTSQRGDTGTNLATANMQVIRKISTWLWCFVHLPRISTISGNLDKRLQRLESVYAHLEHLEQRVASHLEHLEQRVASHLEHLEQRVGRLEQWVNGHQEQWIAGLEQRVTGVRHEILFQQRRLTRLGEVPGVATQAPSDTIDHRLDALYVAFEEVFRGSREDIKERMRVYLDRLVLSGAGQPGKPILDVGCGRGEWLEILKECQLQAYGIDCNVLMVERARSFGLDAREADLMAHLRDLPDASRSAVTAFHVVEHLGFGVLVDFLDEVLRVLIPGGMLILETPNPENLCVGANSFYNDPTHHHPLPPEPLRFLVDQRGFAETEVLRLHPFPVEEHFKVNNEDTRRLNDLLFGPQDYAVIARRA